jgi:hypothetical protein
MKRNKSGRSWLVSLFTLRFYRSGTVHNDKVLPESRWTAFFIVPFLLTGFIILTVWPNDTGLLFAWPIMSRATALLLGAMYAGGAYFFSRVYLAKQWHKVGMGFIPAIGFAILGGLVTLLEWGTFNVSSIAFVVWVAVFAITPWLFPMIWYRNRSLDPRMPAPNDVVLPVALRDLWIMLGLSNLVIGAVLFFTPDLVLNYWPWQVSTLDLRMIGSLFAMLGMTGLALAVDLRWSSAQVILETTAITLGLAFISLARSWSLLDQANPITWVFSGFVFALLVGISVLYLWVEIR